MYEHFLHIFIIQVRIVFIEIIETCDGIHNYSNKNNYLRC